MMFNRLSIGFCAAALSTFAFSSATQAASFQTNASGMRNPEGDILLQSITQNGVTFSNFSFVNAAQILSNTPITDVRPSDTANPELASATRVRNNNTGAASTDAGDNASTPLPVSGVNNPTGSAIAAFVGNNNLNNIIDTEDSGSFQINLFFDRLITGDDSGLDNLFFWERGMNSDLRIQAINAAGSLIGAPILLSRSAQTSAGYSIDTTEISGAQRVGSWGVKLSQLGVNSLSGVRVSATSAFNGPDWKVVARAQEVPEPATVSALLLTGLAALTLRKKRESSDLA